MDVPSTEKPIVRDRTDRSDGWIGCSHTLSNVICMQNCARAPAEPPAITRDDAVSRCGRVSWIRSKKCRDGLAQDRKSAVVQGACCVDLDWGCHVRRPRSAIAVPRIHGRPIIEEGFNRGLPMSKSSTTDELVSLGSAAVLPRVDRDRAAQSKSGRTPATGLAERR